MAVSKPVFECPFCDEILEVEPPDKRHLAYSSKKPVPRSFHGEVLKKKHKCQNPECKKSTTLYWYAPLDYLNRL